jgi:transcription-repair coupling factor (superfamily II helicase)
VTSQLLRHISITNVSDIMGSIVMQYFSSLLRVLLLIYKCMLKLFEKAQQSAEISKFVRALNEKDSMIVEGLWDAPKALLTAAAFQQRESCVLFLFSSASQCDPVYDGIVNFIPHSTLMFPSWETLPHEEGKPHPEIVSDRFNVLSKLARTLDSGEKFILALDIQSMMQKILPPEIFLSLFVHVKVGDALELDRLMKKAVTAGYEHEHMVEEKGHFAHRGGIFDIYPVNMEYPVRIEFFGDEVESIRKFDIATQRSVERVERVEVAPLDEMDLYDKYRKQLSSIMSYLPDDTVVMLDNINDIESRAEEIEGLIPEHSHHYYKMSEIDKILSSKKKVYFQDLAVAGRERLSDEYVDLKILPPDSVPGVQAFEIDDGRTQIEFFKSLPGWLDSKYEMYFVCNNTGELDRLKMVFEEKKVKLSRKMRFVVGSLNTGFCLPDINMLAVCDREIFHRYKIRRKVRRFKGTTAIYDFSDLRNGDYVVHAEYGIGMYRGLTTLDGQPENREFMAIEYKEKSKLYVPIAQANLITKYIGSDRSRPPVDELGGPRWSKVRKRTEKAVMDYAMELLELYAARESLQGTAFSPDTLWQKEFEDAFIYNETEDQIEAIENIKKDMERPRPMDRLICGDVGYGKTEVAIRAAFKAVMDGKQVAVLVPTTVLAQQHFHTFTERMADYPVRVEMLSRFRTRSQQQKILAGFKAGTVDIVIGTHRLVQNDVVPKDIGLVIVDEEQRFGVHHKEKLKHLRRLTDVITMTATPIPRTLYMSLIGARDMSNIDTPPMDRLPVKTILTEFTADTIKMAIDRELARDGQVFFLHNRVKTIDKMEEYLQRLVPNATIVHAHGQMHERQLESIMEKFIEGKIDVLVCTTIIESGIDIPNANTIIIDNAHRFGLADLYQLRGRVGRWKHQAYAYLMVPRDREVMQIARKRLRAVIESQGYGAGFKIAMHDLEIRGAGNILGTEQSGHVAAIGFNLYCNLLKRAVASLQGQEVPDYSGTTIKIDIDARIPDYYIPDTRQRIDIYRRLGDIVSPEQFDDMKKGLSDRFGAPPQEVSNLLNVVDIRLWAQKNNISSVELSDDKIITMRQGRRLMSEGKFPRTTTKDPNKIFKQIKQKVEPLMRN